MIRPRGRREAARLPITLGALALRPGGAGVSTYIAGLVSALPGVVSLPLTAVVQHDAAAVLPPGVGARVRPVCAGARRALEGLRPVGDASLVHGLDVDLPVGTACPTVTTVHDLSVFDAPWAFPRRRVVGERILVARALRRADAVIAVSHFTAERIRTRFGRDAVVTHQAPRADLAPASATAVARARRTYGLPERFVLHVGSVEPRKDVGGLADACRRSQVPLLLAGAAATSPPPAARALGYVPAEDLPALYGAATLVAYPSRYEGFGLPPLEAMACGAPVLATRVPSLVECAPDAAELVPVGDVDALAGALGALLADGDRRHELAEAGRAAVARLSWRGTAEATAAVYRSLGVDAPDPPARP